MKTLEKKVHFVVEGESIACYDSKGNPMNFVLIGGTPYIELDRRTDRFFDIDSAACHSIECQYGANYANDKFTHRRLRGVINRKFVDTDSCMFNFAERPCSYRELASYHLAKYKAYKNMIKIAEVKHG